MSVFDFVQRHIDAVKHSMRNVESEKIYCFLYLLLEAPYYHLYHGLSRERENHWSKIKYKNSDDWGYADYNKVDINDNTVLVYGKDASIEYD